MILEKIKLKNFKRFADEKEIEFNDDFNVLIGDNESGKTTIFTALDLVLSGSQSKVETIGLDNLFNVSTINNFMCGTREYGELPELYIEVYLKETGNSDLNGENHTDGNYAKDGLRFECKPNDDYSKEIMASISNEDGVFPYEYYICTFKTFSKMPYNSYRKYVKHILIDNSTINNEYAMKEYTNSLYSSYADIKIKNSHKNKYRKLKNEFSINTLGEFNQELGETKFGLSNGNKFNLENSLTIYENDINIWNKGTGKQCVVKTEFALNKQIENIDLILIEEPENHLSYINMKKLLNKIVESTGKQLFVTTHNSMICSRLNLKKIICMNSNNEKTMEFKNIEEDTAKFFIKTPSNEILNFILSKKVILVEGAAEYILMEKFYEITSGERIDNKGISIISVNGLSFLRYLEVARKLNIKVAVITDNDKDYQTNIIDKYEEYKDEENIEIFSDSNNENNTFEVSIYKNNIQYINDNKITTRKDKQKFMLNNKSENAYRILEKLEEENDTKDEVKVKFIVPNYIERAIEWIKN